MSACNSDIVRQGRIASPGSLALQPLVRGSDMVQHRLAPDKKTALKFEKQEDGTRLFRNNLAMSSLRHLASPAALAINSASVVAARQAARQGPVPVRAVKLIVSGMATLGGY